MKWLILFCGVFVYGYADQDADFCEIDSINQETPCGQEGGMCVVETDCPPGKLTEEKGLCPTQQWRGVECCYGLSVKETRCRKRGGECFRGADPCNPNVIFASATDCPKYTTCCILVG